MATMFRKPPPLLVPGSGAKPLRLAGQAAFASGAEPPPYVLHCVPVSGQGYLFAGSDDSLRLFSPTLEPGPRLKSTQKGITSLSVGAGEGSTAVFSTAKDGTVVGWDTRDMSKEAFKLKGKSGAAYLTASQSSDLSCLAVGTELHHYEAMIDMWDLRTMSLRQTYTEAHSDDITHLAFHPSPSLPHVLLSASVDGLLNTYDVRIADEDDSVLSTAQVGSSLNSAGWMALKGQEADPDYKGIWGATTIETIQLWDAEDDFDDIRDVALEPWRSDYLIGAHYNRSLGGLCIMVGTQKGDVAIVNLADPERWVLEQVLPGVGGRTLATNGHSDIVRCAHLDTNTSTVVTGGEDGRICLWKL